MPLTTPPAKAHMRWRDMIFAATQSQDWRKEWRRYLNADAVFGFGSARAGLVALLGYLKTHHLDRVEVVLPAYTCSTVAKAVEAAGLVPVLCDMLPESSWPDLTRLDTLCSHRTLAVISTNLFGIPDPMMEMRRLAKKTGAYLVEDLSLALGSTVDGVRLGTFGDAAVVSLGVSKVITTYKGGVLLLHGDLAKKVERESPAELLAPWSRGNVRAAAMLALYPLLLSRVGFGALQSTPLRLNDSPEVLISQGRRGWSEFQARYSALALRSLDARVARRQAIGISLVDITRRAGFATMAPARGDAPSYLRFPIYCRSSAEREHLVKNLRQAGIHASRGFLDIKTHLTPAEHPAAIAICERLLTLPSHPGLTERDLAKISEVLVLGRKGAKA